MAFGGEVDNAVHVFGLHQFVNAFEVANVHLDELVIGLALDVFQVGEIASIGQFVEIDDIVIGVLVHK